jgi:very-short-patch-repair endonuclease
MSKDYQQFHELFLDKEKTMSLVDGLIERLCSERLTEKQQEDETKAFTEGKLIRRYIFEQLLIKPNFELIHEYAESPIEKIFLNSLCYGLMLKGAFPVCFTPPREADTYPDFIRKTFQEAMHIWKLFQKDTGDENAREFLDFLKNLSPDEKEMLGLDDSNYEAIEVQVILYHGCNLYNGYHLTLQPTFESIRVNGKHIRADLFIWIPSRPEFKLIVECDGFEFHSNKTAFSRDRARDRILQGKGYQVFRFSGQEIFHNPIGMAHELYTYLVDQYNQLFPETKRNKRDIT